MKRIILSSGSPRRRELLSGLGYDFTLDTENNFNEGPEPGVEAHRVPLDMSIGKSHGFHRALEEDEVLITADTVVIIDSRVLGKPHSRDEAIEMLKELSGRDHEVVTAVTLRSPNKELSFRDSTIVSFAPITDEEIERYIDAYKPYDKAGAYGVQEWIGYACIRGINGSFYNVMGLPVQKLYEALKEF